MRRGISIALLLFGLSMAMGGICKLFPPYNKMFYPPHISSSFIFVILAVIHVWLNRKPLISYFKRLKLLGWMLVGLGIVTILWMGVGLPLVLRGR